MARGPTCADELFLAAGLEVRDGGVLRNANAGVVLAVSMGGLLISGKLLVIVALVIARGAAARPAAAAAAAAGTRARRRIRAAAVGTLRIAISLLILVDQNLADHILELNRRPIRFVVGDIGQCHTEFLQYLAMIDGLGLV